jgi:acetoin utilization deacetylase AcuC-like enzyme
MLPFKLVYSDGYDLNLGAHVFPSQKYRLVYEKLLAEGDAEEADFLSPSPATDEDVLRVHGAEWVEKLKTGNLDTLEVMRMEVPYSPELVQAVWLAAGGSTLAGRRALEDGCAFNLAGGLHHAYPDHGEGFCPIHDVAVAIRTLQADGSIKRALTVDLDVHHGNGTAAIFAEDDTVVTLSLHQQNNYPAVKPPSDIDVGLEDGAGDGEYLRRLEEALARVFEEYPKPDLIFYLAGADAYCEDQLGGLGLTFEGLRERDRRVFGAFLSRSIPVAVTLAGGYARSVGDTIEIHRNTVLAARECFTPQGRR